MSYWNALQHALYTACVTHTAVISFYTITYFWGRDRGVIYYEKLTKSPRRILISLAFSFLAQVFMYYLFYKN